MIEIAPAVVGIKNVYADILNVDRQKPSVGYRPETLTVGFGAAGELKRPITHNIYCYLPRSELLLADRFRSSNMAAFIAVVERDFWL